MAISVKICGLSTPDSLRAAVSGGASMIGFVFVPLSPRHVTPVRAAELAGDIPDDIERVGLFVDATSEEIDEAAKTAGLSMVQLHGDESPEQVSEVKALTQLPVIKAISIRDRRDLGGVSAYEAVADMLLFDAKPDPDKDRLPGGNARAFDWSVLKGNEFSKPWLLAGGLTPENLEEAVKTTGAVIVDVSSGVERDKGVKDPSLIKSFLNVASTL